MCLLKRVSSVAHCCFSLSCIVPCLIYIYVKGFLHFATDAFLENTQTLLFIKEDKTFIGRFPWHHDLYVKIESCITNLPICKGTEQSRESIFQFHIYLWETLQLLQPVFPIQCLPVVFSKKKDGGIILDIFPNI